MALEEKDGIELRTPTEETVPAIADSMNRCFADYPIPYFFGETGVRDFMHITDIALDQSVIVVAGDGKVVGQSLTGQRGDRAWIAATGLVPDHRNRGIGTRMLRFQLEKIKAAGAHEVTIEVLSTNDQVKKLYEGLGFKFRRDLYSYRRISEYEGALDPPDHLRFEPCQANAILDFYRPDHTWYLMKETVEKSQGLKAFLSFLTVEAGPARASGLSKSITDPMADLHDEQELPSMPDTPDVEALTTPHGPELEGYCVYREDESGVWIVDVYSVANARLLVKHLMTLTGKRSLFATNVFDGPTVMAYETLGFKMWIKHHELRMYI